MQIRRVEHAAASSSFSTAVAILQAAAVVAPVEGARYPAAFWFWLVGLRRGDGERGLLAQGVPVRGRRGRRGTGRRHDWARRRRGRRGRFFLKVENWEMVKLEVDFYCSGR